MELRIERRKVEDLIPAIYNPRKALKPGDPEFEKLKRSIEEFGYVDPVIWNERTGMIVGGHQRLSVMRELGVEEVDVSVVDMDEKREKALNIALNKIEGAWDMPLLKDLIQDLDDGSFDVELTGFDMAEIEDLMTQFHVEEPGEAEEDQFDVDEYMGEGRPIMTQRGDVWLLGRHRIMCGDSVHLREVSVLMDGRKADMVFTDPPYGVSYQSNMRQKTEKFEVLKNDDIFLDILPALQSFSNQNIHWYIWTSHHVYPVWREKFDHFYKHTIIWDKGGGGMGDLAGNYASDYEMALFCQFGRRELTGKREGAVWDIAKDNNKDYVHPTQKPVALAAYALEKSSNAGDVVLDLFGGSGSTMMACEQTGRISYTMELDPKYTDAIVQRYVHWKETGGDDVVLIRNGERFSYDEVQERVFN